jgi:gas vesicle protein
MNIEELLQSLPSREDIASAVGLQSRSTTTDLLPALGLFGTGMLFGAGLALLFAPKSGNELRRDLSQKAQQYGDQARDMVEETGRQYAGQYGGSQSGQYGTQSTTESQGSESEQQYRSPYTGSRNI